MAKYFKTKNASRPVIASGREFNFEATSFFAGAWSGVFAAETPEDEAALGLLADNPTSGVTEITQEAYEQQLKKKGLSPGFRLAPSSSPPPPPKVVKAAASLESRVGVPAEANTAPPPTTGQSTVPERVEDVVKFGQVKPPETQAQRPKRKAAKKTGARKSKPKTWAESEATKPPPQET